jgi:hypothetical protein
MEAAASSLSSLLATLRVVGPWTPPANWESVTQAGGAARTANPGGRLRGDPIYELASVPVSEKLPTNALRFSVILSIFARVELRLLS